jgi:hypothetical protein
VTDKEFAEALGRVIEYARGALGADTDVLVVAANPGRHTHCGTTELGSVRAPFVIETLARAALDAVEQGKPQRVTVAKDREGMT